jgi:hypothetical protein
VIGQLYAENYVGHTPDGVLQGHAEGDRVSVRWHGVLRFYPTRGSLHAGLCLKTRFSPSGPNPVIWGSGLKGFRCGGRSLWEGVIWRIQWMMRDESL